MTGIIYDNKIYPNAQGLIIKHIHFDQIDSTNTWAKTNVDQWSAQGITLITASEQTAGRGRLNRRWSSPPHVNIYATFCFWFDPKRNDVGHIPQLLALAAATVLEKEHLLPKIKWPNDLVLNGKKVGGILCETILEGDRRGVVCGIGLNVNMEKKEIEQIDRPATSLLIESGHKREIETLLQALSKIFNEMLTTFISEGFSSFFPLFQKMSLHKKGDQIQFHDFQTLITAQFEMLHPNGSVELRLSNGTKKIYHSGEFILF